MQNITEKFLRRYVSYSILFNFYSVLDCKCIGRCDNDILCNLRIRWENFNIYYKCENYKKKNSFTTTSTEQIKILKTNANLI